METDLDLVALSPGDLPATQQALTAWCDQKQQTLKTELADLEEHALIAAGNGWRLSGIHAAIKRTERRLVYYDKVKAAVEAGYLMVPNFPVTVLAVRVARTKQKEQERSWDQRFSATPELLPAGEGRYVDDALFSTNESYDKPDGKGGTTTVRRYISGDYDAPDFPFTLVKPAVIAATERAMALRVFDQIGMVENTAPADPIMVGQILDPRGNQRRVTFFIAWWLNTATL